MGEVVDIKDRFYEIMPENKREEERQKEGWILIMDRATGKCILTHANSRENALWILRALNYQDTTQDNMPKEEPHG